MKNLPIKLGIFYVYDACSVDMELLRDSNVFTIGVAYTKEEEDTIIEKFAALNFVMATEKVSTFTPTKISQGLGISAPDVEQLKEVNLRSLTMSNKVVRLHKGFDANVKKSKLPYEKAVLYELGHHIPADYMNEWRSACGI